MTSNEVGTGQREVVASGLLDRANKQREEFLLALIVRVFPKKALFVDNLSWTLACFSSEMGMNADDVRIVLVPANPEDNDSSMLKAASACLDPQVEVCPADALDDVIGSCEYVMLVNQGDCFVGDTALHLLELLRKRQHEIIRVQRSAKETKSLATLSSAYVAPYRVVLRPDGVILKTSYVPSADVLLSYDLGLSSMLVCIFQNLF